MVKRLAILSVAVWVGGVTWAQVPGDGGRENSKPHNGSNEGTISEPVRSPAVNTEQRAADQKDDANAQPSHYPWHEVYAPATLPNWGLVLVGAWAGLLAYGTLRSIENQAEQLKVQVGLMREQMDRSAQRERARLSLEIQEIDIIPWEEDCLTLHSCIEITNTGHSNAYIRFGAVSFAAGGTGLTPLPQAQPEDFDVGLNAIEPSKDTAYVPVDISYITSTIKKFAENVANGNLRLYLYGFVEYETLGIRWHRDFGYVWTVWESSTADGIVFSTPKDEMRLRLAGGQWEQDVQQKNGEYQILKPN